MTEITLNKNIRFGKPTIKGTRIGVDDVLGALSGGMTFEQVEEEYRIKRADILAVLKYATKVMAEERIGILAVSK
jgi:uncharacterized protein (DUF433 family)